MMKLGIENGSFTIDDNNNNIVDEKTKKQLEKDFINNEDNINKNLPNMTIKD